MLNGELMDILFSCSLSVWGFTMPHTSTMSYFLRKRDNREVSKVALHAVPSSPHEIMMRGTELLAMAVRSIPQTNARTPTTVTKLGPNILLVPRALYAHITPTPLHGVPSYGLRQS